MVEILQKFVAFSEYLSFTCCGLSNSSLKLTPFSEFQTRHFKQGKSSTWECQKKIADKQGECSLHDTKLWNFDIIRRKWVNLIVSSIKSFRLILYFGKKKINSISNMQPLNMHPEKWFGGYPVKSNLFF